MRTLLIVLSLCTVTGVGAWLGSALAAGGTDASGAALIARPGDVVRVPNTAIACRVIRAQAFGDRVAFDCRRGGPLAGTYGTLLTGREAAVVEFVNRGTARVLLVAKHDGEARRCA